ncbi:MAG: cysteine-rich repeat protein [Flavobacteriales bacterium]|jgi:cysteine-rich repeat protein
MVHMTRITRSLLALLCVSAIGSMSACGTDAPGETPADDTGVDAVSDGVDPDVDEPDGAETDTGVEDTTTDVEPDTTTDVVPDADPDVEPDTTTDVDLDVDPDAEPDVAPDVVVPENCGDGVLDDDEECDDGNDDDMDTCTSLCRVAACGDGFVGVQPGGVVETEVIVTNLQGIEGPVCSTGATCASGACDVADDGTASEHGICQALGYDRAVSVVWGGSFGAETDPAPRAGNWGCFDYECFEGPRPDSDGACGDGNMLASITCEGFIPEPCDDGANGDAPNQCREGCALPVCGDGIADDEFGEDCDDANDNPADGCNNCLFPSCGDAVVQTGEDCDDGNDSDEDACRTDCTFPVCGDGNVQPGEECDDGDDNSEAADACRPTCLFAACGDLVLDTGEECDDGNRVADDGCSNNCLTPQCGDGITQVDTGEECDDGNDNNLDACDNACVAAVCGDGILQSEIADLNEFFDFEDGAIPAEFVLSGEADWAIVEDAAAGAFAIRSGDVADNEGSSFSLTVTTANPFSVSFDWKVESETCCDELNVYVDDVFVAEFVGQAAYGPGEFDVLAGEHVVRFSYEKDSSASTAGDSAWVDNLRFATLEGVGEECDDAELNADEADACRLNCALPACGDAIVDAGEACDDGNDDDFDVCRNTCVFPVCGDGVLQGDEECDAGDENSDEEVDGCRTDCRLAFCTDGVIDAGEVCDDGNEIADDGCSNNCREPGCLDGVVQDGEECDDGNEVDDDLCTNECTLPVCGDGVRQGDEDCDDGNDDELDVCLSTCQFTTCGDGVVNGGFFGETFESPQVENPFGATGPICDDGQSCFDDECFYLEAPNAPEHGICQALGYDRTDSILWGNGEGADSITMPHVYNWICENFVCTGSTNEFSTDNCGVGEMLNTITCQTGRLETCDDGELNADEPNTCRTNCTAPMCGDGIVDDGEDCDDANDIEDDTCSTVCAAPTCGDGIRQGDEDCDDANEDETDACMDDCAFPLCGDGIINTSIGRVTISNPIVTIPGATGGLCGDTEFGDCVSGEDCDVSASPGASEHGVCQALGFQRADSVRYGTDDIMAAVSVFTWFCEDFECEQDDNFFFFCDSFDVMAEITCAGSTVETCDNGELNEDVADVCRTDCQLPECGDGILDTGEECDDGNDIEDDFCSSICAAPFCGDGIRQGDEACDNGAENSDSAPDACRLDCSVAACGDLVIDSAETCDDGNDVDNDECRNDCVIGSCGDGTVDDGEPCDDGNLVENDGCRSNCTAQFCGDGLVDEGEECDDGNAVEDDLCTTACLFNGVPGTDEFLGTATGPGVASGAFPDLTDDNSGTCGSVGGSDIVYGWIAPAAGDYQFDTCGSTSDTLIYVRDGSGSGDELLCNDDNGGVCGESLSSAVTLTMTSGQTIAIVVDGYNDFATLGYTLNITAL